MIRMIKKYFVYLFLIGCGGFTFGMSLQFNDVSVSMENKHSLIHFNAGGNDFAGVFIWLQSKELETPQEINSKECYRQLRGFYYNGARGSMVWPLDMQTKDYLNHDNLTFTGGFYTNCTGDAQEGAVYGLINYNLGGVNSYLIAGTKYDYQNNKYDISNGLVKSLEYMYNKTPVGYVYDTVGGIGFVGGTTRGGDQDIINEINNGNSVSDMFYLTGENNDTLQTQIGSNTYTVSDFSIEAGANTILKIGVVGNALFSETGIKDGLQGMLTNQSSDSKVAMNKSSITTINALLNSVSKQSSIVCRGKWQTSSPIATDVDSICVDNNNDVSLNIQDIVGKTVVVKGGDLNLEGFSMGNKNEYLDIYVDKGNLVLNDNNITHSTCFDGNGKVVDCGDSSVVTSGTNLNGVFIVNGLIVGSNNKDYSHKTYIHGQSMSLNSLGDVSSQRKDLVEDVLGTNSYNDSIGLYDVFSRRCNEIEGVSDQDGNKCSDPNDKYKFNPLTFIYRRYQSNLIK